MIALQRVLAINLFFVQYRGLDYEKGVNNIEIDFLLQFPMPNEVKFNLNSFLHAIDRAKKLAIECAKEDELRNQSKLENKDSDLSDL